MQDEEDMQPEQQPPAAAPASSPPLEDDEPSQIAMASAVAAPMPVRPRPPRAVHINGSSNSITSTTTSTSNLKRRVPPPKLTQDEALEASSKSNAPSPASMLSGSPSMEKDRFAALLALGVAHQQQQLHNLIVTRPSASRSASSSSTVQLDSSSGSATNPTVAPAAVASGEAGECHSEIASNPASILPSSSPSTRHADDPASLTESNAVASQEHAQLGAVGRAQLSAPQVYVRPDRSASDVSLDIYPSTSSTTGTDGSAILQQHRIHPRPGQQLRSASHSTASSSYTPPSSSTAIPSIVYTSTPSTNPSSTATSNTSSRMAALAAKWGSSASAKMQSISSGINGNSRAGPSTCSSKGSTSPSLYTSDSDVQSGVPSNAHGLAISGIAKAPTPARVHAPGHISSQADMMPLPVKGTAEPSTGNTVYGIGSTSSSASSIVGSNHSSNASIRQSGLHGHGKEALSKTVNIAARLRNAASNKMKESNHSFIASGTTASENEEVIGELTSFHKESGGADQAFSSDKPHISKSSSLRSLSSFGNAIKTSSSSNLRKISSSFSSSSSSSLSSASGIHPATGVTRSASSSGTTSQEALRGSSISSGGGGSGLAANASRRLGLHRATPSSISTSLGLTHRHSPLSSATSTSTPYANQVNTNDINPMNRPHNNTRYKNILGTNVPIGRAGEVFGAPLHVAADRTRLIKDANEDAPDVNGTSPGDEEIILRRKEACLFLPAIAIRCLDYLNEYGKTEEGLYRIPGSTLQISNLRTIFDAGQDLDLLSKLDTRILEPSAVASCFKLWLRELPESLLHNMEREIDILLLEHTGNAASSKVTMAQAQSPSPPNSSNSSENFSNQQKMPQILGVSSASHSNKTTAGTASPLVIGRIKDLFANNLPKENVILLREISYHLAHLASFSNVTKMTFANLRLILSPTLRLSPVMLSLLVNEREQVFPKPGTFMAAYQIGCETIRFNDSNLDLSLPLSSDSRVPADQPRLTLSIPTGEGLPPIPPRKSPMERYGQRSKSTSTTPPTVSLRTPFSSSDSSWASFSSPGQSSLVSGQRKVTNSKLNSSYRASWHVVDLPAPGASNPDRKDSSESTYSDANDVERGGGGHIATPIAKKFLNQRASLSNLLDNKERANSPSSPAPSEAGSRRSVSSNGSNMLTRTPTLTGRSPSPFFSSGAPPAALGFLATHSRKRSSASSLASIVSNSAGTGAIWRARKVSPQHDQSSTIPYRQQQQSTSRDEDEKEEEEELSHSDTNTSICSSASSAKTPKDQEDLAEPGRSSEIVHIAELALDDGGAGDSLGAVTNASLDTSKRATITAESFGRSFARTGQGRNANTEEMKKKRGSVMITNMPSFP